MRLKTLLRQLPIALAALGAAGFAEAQARRPVIDVHLHAFDLAWFKAAGEPPLTMCEGAFWPSMLERFPSLGECRGAVQSPATEQALLDATMAALARYNVIAVTSGPRATVARWRTLAPRRIIPAVGYATSPDSARRWAADTAVRALGEMTWQYDGMSATDSLPSAWFALAEELDLPIGVHMGFGPAGAPFVMSPAYRMALSNPLQLEPVLVRHPKLRIWVMHAGWPMLDQMVGLLQTYPQVYVDVSAIDWFIPRAEFHTYLRRLVQAGFANRIMFGSDQMVWPAAIGRAIDAIESAPFLSARDKRDILCRNAARFFRLKQSHGDSC